MCAASASSARIRSPRPLRRQRLFNLPPPFFLSCRQLLIGKPEPRPVSCVVSQVHGRVFLTVAIVSHHLNALEKRRAALQTTHAVQLSTMKYLPTTATGCTTDILVRNAAAFCRHDGATRLCWKEESQHGRDKVYTFTTVGLARRGPSCHSAPSRFLRRRL